MRKAKVDMLGRGDLLLFQRNRLSLAIVSNTRKLRVLGSQDNRTMFHGAEIATATGAEGDALSF